MSQKTLDYKNKYCIMIQQYYKGWGKLIHQHIAMEENLAYGFTRCGQ